MNFEESKDPSTPILVVVPIENEVNLSALKERGDLKRVPKG